MLAVSAGQSSHLVSPKAQRIFNIFQIRFLSKFPLLMLYMLEKKEIRKLFQKKVNA